MSKILKTINKVLKAIYIGIAFRCYLKH